MSAAEKVELENLPEVRGRYTQNAPLGTKSWFACGGVADVLFKPKDLEDLQNFLLNCPKDVPLMTFGAMSNVIIRDGGVSGVVIRLGREFSNISTDGDVVIAGALALDANVALKSAEAGIGRLEFLSGIPGSIGGALRMNAGCYDTETKDVLVECETIDRNGKLHRLKPDDMGMTYRHTTTPEDFIFTKAIFQGRKESANIVQERIEAIKEKRENSQPIREKTGGSTFANPKAEDLEKAGLSPETRVWQLIDRVGGRGLTVGGAKMSEKHCNFMINTGNAKSQDLEELGDEVKRRVEEAFGIHLRWEIKRVGNK